MAEEKMHHDFDFLEDESGKQLQKYKLKGYFYYFIIMS
jgi:hypothetical protein